MQRFRETERKCTDHRMQVQGKKDECLQAVDDSTDGPSQEACNGSLGNRGPKKAGMSENEIKRRQRRAAVAAQHGHPAPKRNQIPADRLALANGANSQVAAMQQNSAVAGVDALWNFPAFLCAHNIAECTHETSLICTASNPGSMVNWNGLPVEHACQIHP